MISNRSKNWRFENSPKLWHVYGKYASLYPTAFFLTTDLTSGVFLQFLRNPKN